MQSLYKIKKHIFIFLMTIALCSCSKYGDSTFSLIRDGFSCRHLLPDQYIPIDCYRFDYSSMDRFKDSMTKHAYRHNLKDPSNALSQLTTNKDLSIESGKDSEELITAYPEDIFVLGRYIRENHKPREWLFAGEQAFLRSWNNLNR